jgi:aminopeptidase N
MQKAMKITFPPYVYLRRPLMAILVVIVLLGHSYAERRERLIDTWQPLNFDLALTLNETLSEIVSATAEIRVLIRKADVNVVDLDFGSMHVSSVAVNGRPASFEQRDNKLNVNLPANMPAWSTYNFSIRYSGVPQDGLVMVKDKDGRPTAIGDNWPDRVHNWIPCLDHPSAKAPVKFTVTAPSRDTVVANGVLESKKENTDKTTTWTWNEASPVSPYNMVIAAGQFATSTINPNGAVPISYYVAPSDKKYGVSGFSPAGPAVRTFGKLIEFYPYQKLALIVGATRFGGMENANTIVFTPNLFNNFNAATPRSRRFKIPESVETVVAHEIAHQWFGDSVTESTWADLWLSEGFATYFAGLFLERDEGPAAFRKYMQKQAAGYLAYEKLNRSPIYDTRTEKLMDLLNPNNYNKGAWVLHSLRGLLGDKMFFDGLRYYYQSKRSGTASTEDLRASLEKVSGKNLRGFFDRWIYKAGHPVYKVSWSPAGAGEIEVKLTQLQADEAFLMPVTIGIATARGVKRIQIVPDGKESSLKVKSARPVGLTVDPDDLILKEVAAN